ncbi:hypothetical protein ABTX99_24490 [Streptomyces flaveolus]|uniref:hypothetical protein n=1 Tax=Streptomyces flaveolus TaxID=67297 RepID=UPI0033166F6C
MHLTRAAQLGQLRRLGAGDVGQRSRRWPRVGREAYGAVLAIVLHDSGRYPDTAMSVVIGDPIACTAVAVSIVQLRTERFDGAKLLGPVGSAAMARVDAALRAVQDL